MNEVKKVVKKKKKHKPKGVSHKEYQYTKLFGSLTKEEKEMELRRQKIVKV